MRICEHFPAGVFTYCLATLNFSFHIILLLKIEPLHLYWLYRREVNLSERTDTFHDAEFLVVNNTDDYQYNSGVMTTPHLWVLVARLTHTEASHRPLGLESRRTPAD